MGHPVHRDREVMNPSAMYLSMGHPQEALKFFVCAAYVSIYVTGILHMINNGT
jgi:hypothetical protein